MDPNWQTRWPTISPVGLARAGRSRVLLPEGDSEDRGWRDGGGPADDRAVLLLDLSQVRQAVIGAVAWTWTISNILWYYGQLTTTTDISYCEGWYFTSSVNTEQELSYLFKSQRKKLKRFSELLGAIPYLQIPPLWKRRNLCWHQEWHRKHNTLCPHYHHPQQSQNHS